jgi:hypothetical protein
MTDDNDPRCIVTDIDGKTHDLNPYHIIVGRGEVWLG